jgi:hypothetical protein
MDARTKYYREEAEKIRREAEGLDIPHIRAKLLKIAVQYDELAADLERKKQRGS